MNSVIVTGAGGALGTATSVFLESQSWNVIRIDSTTVDLTNHALVLDFVSKLDVVPQALVHTVGGIRAGTRIEDTAVDDFEWNLTINVSTTFNIINALMPLFIKARCGSIVTIGARDVLHPQANRSAYAAAKAAVVALTRTVAEEGLPYGVRANVIVPSILRTPANLEWADEQESQNWLTPTDLAQTIFHLIQPECGINGSVIPMYGKVAF